MMTGSLTDTYFALLERPELREFGLTARKIAHRTLSFSAQSYARSANIDFAGEDEAYAHWISEGRSLGLEWAKGKNTMLKIVLKAKDELELIDDWVAHHSEIVGFENLIIVDCGSSNPIYLEKLRFYENKLLILRYRERYDYLHSTESNKSFYEFVARNCRYVTVLDADEFLLGRIEDNFSHEFVLDILKQRQLPFFGGIWVNAFPIREQDTIGKNDRAYGLEVSRNALRSGTVAGKALIRTDVVHQSGHVGHNLHVRSSLSYATPQSFGDVFVIHLKDPTKSSERALKHLIGKSHVLAQGSSSIDEQVDRLLSDPQTPLPVRRYATIFRMGEQLDWEKMLPVSSFIRSSRALKLPKLASVVEITDFSEIIEERRNILT